MTACIFLGPSVSIADALSIYPECRFLPPVQHGSIYEAMQKWPLTAIGVIDGYFQHRPSVWHKEILWALDQGVYVAGAASMGALRAAELAPFGMVGIGKVFKAFELGALPPFSGLNDDDEVAIVHGPEESGFVSVSEAMVNIRHTLEAACAAGIIDSRTAEVLTNEAKSLHFSDRTYSNIIDQTKNQEIPGDLLQRLMKWLPTGKVDQKRADAIELIEHMATVDCKGLAKVKNNFYFETTEIFHDTLQSRPVAPHRDSTQIEWDRDVLDELRLNEENYRNAKYMAVTKCLLAHKLPALSIDNSQTTSIHSETQLQESIDGFRRANGLADREKIDQWLLDNNLTLGELEDLLLGEAQFCVQMMTVDVPTLSTELINNLKLTGSFSALAHRATLKRNMLASRIQSHHQPQQLLKWYFETRNERSLPKDITAHAQWLGLNDEADLLRLLTREYNFLTQNAG